MSKQNLETLESVFMAPSGEKVMGQFVDITDAMPTNDNAAACSGMCSSGTCRVG